MGLSSTSPKLSTRNGAAGNTRSMSARQAMTGSARSHAFALLALAAALLPVANVRAQIGPGTVRFVDVIELTDHDDQADITVQFNCSVRYITHLPASEGTELRVQLQP